MEDRGQVEGRNAVMELLTSKKDINKIFVQSKGNGNCNCWNTEKEIRRNERNSEVTKE